MGVLASAPVRGQYGGVVRQRLKGHEQAVAVVSADGRSCSARPIDGGGLGCVAGPAVLATSELDVRTALNWMPGRILVLAEAALEPRPLGLVVPSAHMATLLGLVLLGEDDLDLSMLVDVDALVPVVSVERASDQRCVRRAVRLLVDVHADDPQLVDLRSHRPIRAHRSGAAVRTGSPGTVKH